jgi:hypothetical protein
MSGRLVLERIQALMSRQARLPEPVTPEAKALWLRMFSLGGQLQQQAAHLATYHEREPSDYADALDTVAQLEQATAEYELQLSRELLN